MKDTPPIVLEKARPLLDRGGFVKYLNRLKGGGIYYGATESYDTGFPFAFVFNGHFVRKVSNFETLTISRSFLGD